MKYFVMAILLILFVTTVHAQKVDYYGKPESGYIMIGHAKNAKSVFLNNKPIQIDKDGYFLFGFDRDDKGEFTVKVDFNDGTSEIKKLNVPEREYVIQKLNNIKEKYVTPPKSELARIEREAGEMKKARTEIGRIDSAYYANGFVRPITGGRLTSVFGSQRILNGVPKSPHNGLDLAAPAGTTIRACADGKVIIAGKKFYYNGNFVLLDHGQGLNSVYLHMRKIFVKDGQYVKKGQKLGEIGTTGRSTGPHLHWGVQWYGKRIDPESLLEMGVIK